MRRHFGFIEGLGFSRPFDSRRMVDRPTDFRLHNTTKREIERKRKPTTTTTWRFEERLSPKGCGRCRCGGPWWFVAAIHQRYYLLGSRRSSGLAFRLGFLFSSTLCRHSLSHLLAVILLVATSPPRAFHLSSAALVIGRTSEYEQRPRERASQLASEGEQ